MISTQRVTQAFVTMADTLVADFDLVDFLHTLTAHAAAVSGAHSVGLVLSDHRGQLQFMASSNESGEALELLQLQSQEGPCRDCFSTGRPVVNADLGNADGLWPSFAPRARAAGFQSVHAFPMRLRNEILGALNIFGTQAVRFDPDEVRIVQALADIATIALIQERAIATAGVLTMQLQTALNSRIVIEQAKGALAQREDISVDQAFAVLRSRARSAGSPIRDVATEVLGQ